MIYLTFDEVFSIDKVLSELCADQLCVGFVRSGGIP